MKEKYKNNGTNYRHKACKKIYSSHGRTSYKTAKEKEREKIMDEEIRIGPLEKILE